jgi:hypothetical protein
VVLHGDLLEIRINLAIAGARGENSQFEGRDGNRGGWVLSLVNSGWAGLGERHRCSAFQGCKPRAAGSMHGNSKALRW